jgi:hypothetical protein
MNLISLVKLIILFVIVITGFVVLGGGTSVQDQRIVTVIEGSTPPDQ